MVATGTVSHLSFPGQFITTNFLNNSPLDLQPRQAMANSLSMCGLLRIRLDSHPLPPRLDIQIPQLDSTHSRLWPGCATMGPDLVGNIRVWPLPTMGRQLYIRRPRIPKSVAMARGP